MVSLKEIFCVTDDFCKHFESDEEKIFALIQIGAGIACVLRLFQN